MSQFDNRIDTNLFRVLDAIYTHGGISAAARVLHLTQPAVTHSLNRLRELFDDELFVRQGNRMVATYKVKSIMPKVQLHLNGLYSTVKMPETFVPQDLDMQFNLACHDAFEWQMLPDLIRHLQTEAPHVKVASLHQTRSQLEMDLSAGTYDVAVDRRLAMGARIRSAHICDEPLVVLMRAGHPLAAGELTRQDYLAAEHASVASGTTIDPIDLTMNEAGIVRKVAVKCQNYYGAARMVATTDWLFTLPLVHAYGIYQCLPMAVQPLPVHFRKISIDMYWHESKQDDEIHSWFRQLVHDSYARKATEAEEKMLALFAKQKKGS